MDTSVLRQVKGDLTRGDWPVLRAAARLGLLEFRLPSVVLSELVDHRRRDFSEIAEHETKAERLRRDIGAPANNSRSATNPEHHSRKVAQDCDNYKDALRAWFGEVGQVLADPTVSHSELVDRVLARRRPFSAGERGYRDALIWYSTLEVAQTGPVILLTANTKDFATQVEGHHQLANDLVVDLKSRGLADDRVVVLTTTSALLRSVLPAWDDEGVREAWSAFISSSSGAAALDEYLNDHLGREFLVPPAAAPRSLWAVGARSVTQVSGVNEIQIVPDNDGWYRVRSVVSCVGRIGGYVWAWGSPDGDVGDFTLWDEWNGLTEYFANDSPQEFGLVVTARFRPVIDVENLEVAEAFVEKDPPGPVNPRLSRVHRSLRALLEMLACHSDNTDFLDDVLADRQHEFEMIVAGVIAEWEGVSDQVVGRYTALSVDNVATVLQDQAGLAGLRADLQLALQAIESTDSDRP